MSFRFERKISAIELVLRTRILGLVHSIIESSFSIKFKYPKNEKRKKFIPRTLKKSGAG